MTWTLPGSPKPITEESGEHKEWYTRAKDTTDYKGKARALLERVKGEKSCL